MKKLLMLTVLFVTPVHAAFDLGKMLEEVVEEAAESVINPTKTKKEPIKTSPTMTREGYILNGGENTDRYNEIRRFYAKEMVDVANYKETIEPYIKEVNDYCPEKYETKRCYFAQEQVNVMKGHTIRKKLIKILGQLEPDRPTYSSSKSVANLTKAEELIEQYKLGNHSDDRKLSQISTDLSHENEIIELKLEKEEQIRKQKNIQLAKSKQVKFVDENIGAMKASPFKVPYQKCLAIADKMISYSKLVNSNGPSKEEESKGRESINKQCSCTYVNIHMNSIDASMSDRKILATDLKKFEEFKLKSIDRGGEPTEWETELFKRSLNNWSVTFLSHSKASDSCN